MGFFKKISDLLTGNKKDVVYYEDAENDDEEEYEGEEYEGEEYDDEEYDDEEYDDEEYDDEEYDDEEYDEGFTLEDQIESYEFVYNSIQKESLDPDKEKEKIKNILKNQETIYNKLIKDSYLKKDFEKFLNKNKREDFVQQGIILAVLILDYHTYTNGYISIDAVEGIKEKRKLLEDIMENDILESEYSKMIYQQQLIGLQLIEKNPYLLTAFNALINDLKDIINERVKFAYEMMDKYPLSTKDNKLYILANHIIFKNMIIINNMGILEYVNFIEEKISSYGEENRIALYTYALMAICSFKDAVNSIDKINYLEKYKISESDSVESIITNLLINGLTNEEIADVINKCCIEINDVEPIQIINKVLKKLDSKNEYFSYKCEDFKRKSFVKKYDIKPTDDDLGIKERVQHYIKKSLLVFDKDYGNLITNNELKSILDNFVDNYEEEFKKCNYLSFAIVDANKIMINDEFDEFEFDFVKEKKDIINETCTSNEIKNKEYINMFKFVYEGMEEALKNLNIVPIFNFIQYKINDMPKTAEEEGLELEENSINYLIEAIQILLSDLIDENLITLEDGEDLSLKFMSLCGILNYLWLSKRKNEKEKLLQTYNITEVDNENIVNILLSKEVEINEIHEILVMLNTNYENPLDEQFYNPRDFENLIDNVKKAFDRKRRLYKLSNKK